MESKRTGDSIGAMPRTPTKKPKSTSRVKVVASRYAQTLQSKNLERQGLVISTKPKPAAKPHTARERPGFPKRISVPERSTKRPTKVASDPTPTAMTVVATARPLSASTTPRGRTTTHSSTLASAPQTDDDERELLDASYVQLCYVEAQAAAAFRAQEQTAERQLLAAWHVLESKLQLLHDTSLRLDREQHVRRLETNVQDQGAASVQVASRLPALVADLSAVCAALETSLRSVPTPGVRACDPQTLLRSVAALETELSRLVQHIEVTHVGAHVGDAVAFERGMAHAADVASASLLQVAHLVDSLVRDVATETSGRIAQIQHERLDAMTAAITRDTGDASCW